MPKRKYRKLLLLIPFAVIIYFLLIQKNTILSIIALILVLYAIISVITFYKEGFERIKGLLEISVVILFGFFSIQQPVNILIAIGVIAFLYAVYLIYMFCKEYVEFVWFD